MKVLDQIDCKLFLKLLSLDGYSAPLKGRRLTLARVTQSQLLERAERLAEMGYLNLIRVRYVEATEAGIAAISAGDTPLARDELTLLRACRRNKTRRVRTDKREVTALGENGESRLQRMEEQGLIKRDSELQRFELSDAGKRFLCHEFDPGNMSGTIQISLLTHFARFVRAECLSGRAASPAENTDSTTVMGDAVPVAATSGADQAPETATADPAATDSVAVAPTPPANTADVVGEPVAESPSEGVVSAEVKAANETGDVLDAAEFFAIIRELRAGQGEDELVPLFRIRERVGKRLDRAATDGLLYQLSKEDKIELVTVQEIGQFSDEQINAAIPQEVGGPYFYAKMTG